MAFKMKGPTVYKLVSDGKKELLASKNEQYTELMKQGTDESKLKAEKLLKSASSYNTSGSIGKEKKKRSNTGNTTAPR